MAWPKLITPAGTFAVTLDEVKAQCGVEDASWDALLTDYIAAASAWIEEMTGRSLMAADWRLTLDGFSDAIELAVGPVGADVAVNYIDVDGLPQVIDPGVYSLDLVRNPAWVVRNADESWPEVLDAVNAVSVDFTAGHASAADVPAPLKLALRMLVAFWFENRSPGGEPDGVWSLIGPYRRILI